MKSIPSPYQVRTNSNKLWRRVSFVYVKIEDLISLPHTSPTQVRVFTVPRSGQVRYSPVTSP